MTAGLTSTQARDFLAAIPTAEQLMPPTTVDDAAKLLAAKS